MKKIIWINSFPKSGNTWLRYLISNYFYNPDQILDPKIIKHIPRISIEKYIDAECLNKSKIDISDVFKYWQIHQKEIIKENQNDFLFIKNHSANVNFNNVHFTSEQLSLASIYIVRDPRDVVISLSRFYKKNYDEVIHDILLNKNFLPNIKNKKNDIEFVSSWEINYRSWQSDNFLKCPKLIIRYEDLITDCFGTFKRIILFLSKILNFDLNENQLSFSVNSSDFNLLKKYEEKGNFDENPSDLPFFFKGQSNQWIYELNKNHQELILYQLNDLMAELKYL